jgi:hypothetical protein
MDGQRGELSFTLGASGGWIGVICLTESVEQLNLAGARTGSTTRTITPGVKSDR